MVTPTFPTFNAFRGARCRRERLKWSIHRDNLANRAGVPIERLASFETWGRTPRGNEVGFKRSVYGALRQLVWERAKVTAAELGEVIRADPDRRKFEAGYGHGGWDPAKRRAGVIHVER